jgi:hypothetical protein
VRAVALFLVFIVLVMLGKEATLLRVVPPAECSGALNSKLVAIGDISEDENRSPSIQYIIKFMYPKDLFALKAERHRLSTLKYNTHVWVVRIFPFVWPLHRQDMYSSIRPVNFTMDFYELRFRAADIDGIKLPAYQLVRKELRWEIAGDAGWSNNNISDANLRTLREDKGASGVFGAIYRSYPQANGRNRQYGSEGCDPKCEKCIWVVRRALPEGFGAFTFWITGLSFLFGLPIVIGLTMWFLRPHYNRNNQGHNRYK